ncbi:unnamed protein product [Rotaria sp. Silwood1]|nr:unnamed protein product [Rotaria sp. Silwood1]CAF1684518.1 unnamed protein product [Rotaria sp. Silwood1]
MASENNGSAEDESFPPKFIEWPLDMGLEDDEFRAGYPFLSISPVTSNDECLVTNSTIMNKNGLIRLENSILTDEKPVKIADEMQVVADQSSQPSKITITSPKQYSLVNDTEQKHKNTIHHLGSVEMVHLHDQIPTIPTREIINRKLQENTDFVQNDANRST